MTMAEEHLVLTDDQIDQMFAEAEVRLAAKEATTKAPRKTTLVVTLDRPVQSDALVAPAGQAKTAAVGTQASKDLTVRTPQLVVKKGKVHTKQPFPPSGFAPARSLFFFSMMKVYSQYKHDAAVYPVMGDAPATR